LKERPSKKTGETMTASRFEWQGKSRTISQKANGGGEAKGGGRTQSALGWSFSRGEFSK